MTTNLVSRLIATGVLAAGFTAASALAGLVTSAHATTSPAPSVTAHR